MFILWIVDGEGDWRFVDCFIGFFGGKIKIIVIELMGLFFSEDYCLQIWIFVEIYWDQVFYILNELEVLIEIEWFIVLLVNLYY